MKSDRRTFLKTTGIVGGALLTGVAARTASTPAAAQTGAGGAAKAMTFCTLAARRRLRPRPQDRARHPRRGGRRAGLQGRRADHDHGRARRAGRPRRPQAARRARRPPAHFVAEDKAKFGPCVTNPEKIVCIGLNYRKHAAETGNPVPKQPILFNKYNTALNCCGGEIAVSKEKAEKFDYEAELVIVIGRTARNVAEADAPNYIFGYCTGNDFTARDLQSRSSQWMLGKSLDGSGPIGPWLVTADQVDGDNLKIECRVNGEVRQSSNTSDMVFNCKQLVSYISHHMTLKPGDIIFTGTPEGVISGYPKDKQVWLKPGDKLVTSIEKLGELTFTLT